MYFTLDYVDGDIICYVEGHYPHNFGRSMVAVFSYINYLIDEKEFNDG